MQQTGFQAGSTGKSVFVSIFTASTGLPDPGMVYNSTGLTGGYKRAGAGAAVGFPTVTLASGTAPWASGGFIQVLGHIYRLDIPDGALASGADHVVVVLTATDKVITPVTIDITADNYRAAGFTLAQIGGAAWDELLASHTTANTFGKKVADLAASSAPTASQNGEAARLAIMNYKLGVTPDTGEDPAWSVRQLFKALQILHRGVRVKSGVPVVTDEAFVYGTENLNGHFDTATRNRTAVSHNMDDTD